MGKRKLAKLKHLAERIVVLDFTTKGKTAMRKLCKRLRKTLK